MEMRRAPLLLVWAGLALQAVALIWKTVGEGGRFVPHDAMTPWPVWIGNLGILVVGLGALVIAQGRPPAPFGALAFGSTRAAARTWRRLLLIGAVLQLSGLAFDTLLHQTMIDSTPAHYLIRAGAFAALVGAFGLTGRPDPMRPA